MDSLMLVLKQAKEDTTRVKIYVELSEICEINDIPQYAEPAIKICEQHLQHEKEGSSLQIFYLKKLATASNNMGFMTFHLGQMGPALKHFEKSLSIQLKTRDKAGAALVYNNLGQIYSNDGNISEALDSYEKAKDLYTEVGNKLGAAQAITNQAVIYRSQGDILKALELFHKTLKIREAEHDQLSIANSLNHLGILYTIQKDRKKALEYFEKSLKIREEQQEKQGVAASLNNMAAMYMDKEHAAKALDYYTRSQKIYEELKDLDGIGTSFSNVAKMHALMGDSLSALDFFRKSLETYKQLNSKNGMTYAYSNLASTLLKMGRMDESIDNAEKSLVLARELGYPGNIGTPARILSIAYQKQGNYKKAYDMLLLYKQMEDSVTNDNNRKASLQKSFEYAYEKKAATDSIKAAENTKLFNMQIAEEKKQRTLLYVGIGLIALFSVFMYNRFRLTRKQKQIIEIQKKEVDEQRGLADSRREIAENQKQLIEEKQKEILDSIHYAKRIQQAMLTSEEYISRHFEAEYFIFYQPKDIVSGDFYWALAHHHKFYMVVADCTGHGVPGAFMSLLNISTLSSNIIEKGIEKPADILNEQRKDIIAALNPTGHENSKDGMDCVLCAFDLQHNTLQVAAANNPLWLIRNGILTVYKADKMPVGKYEDNAKDFTNHTIALEKGDVIYLFTDGYVDQFGGQSGKKFMHKRLQQVVLEHQHLPMKEQHLALSKTINDWRGNHDQIDDILLMGIRI